MGDKKKILTITLCSTLISIPAIAGITIGIVSLVKRRKEQDKIIETITIATEIDPISLEEGKTLTSNPIVVKCFNKKKEEIESESKLTLYDESYRTIQYDWININNNNQIVISEHATIGNYKFYLQASTTNNKILSDFKEILVSIVAKPTPPEPIVIDKITIDNVEDFDMFENSTKNVLFKCRCWDGEKEVNPKNITFDWNFSCYDIEGSQNPPECLKDSSTTCNTMLKLKSTTTSGLVGTYKLEIEAKCYYESKTFIAKIGLNLKVVSGTIYTDENGYVYKRELITDNWKLSSAKSNIQILDNVKSKIVGFPVTEVDENFALNSNVKSSLTSVILPTSIIKINDNAFKDCTKLQNVEIPSVKYVGNNAFESCGLMNFINQKPVFESIGDNAFYSCENLQITNLKNCESIGSQAFFNSGIIEVELSENLTQILTNTFANCKSLASIKIWAINPPKMEGDCFANSNNLKSIYVPKESLEQYKQATIWKNYQNIIKSME